MKDQGHSPTHSHSFGQDRKWPGKNPTIIVIAVTFMMMIVEIATGILFVSMALMAIVALLAAKYTGLVWIDPLMGIIGAIMVSHWSLSLLRSTSQILLDRQAPAR